MKKPALLKMSFADSANIAPRAMKHRRKTTMLLSSLLITAPGFAFAGRTALEKLRGMAQTAPAVAPALETAEMELTDDGEQVLWGLFEESAPDLGVGTSAHYL
ncbi:MAG: hypothetical protein NTX59_00645 [Elusimicrobia bacterium]|nr:hypothetical protein [Elusimicrobiota bacterium]